MHNNRTKNVLNVRCVCHNKAEKKLQKGVTNLRHGAGNDKADYSGDRNIKII